MSIRLRIQQPVGLSESSSAVGNSHPRVRYVPSLGIGIGHMGYQLPSCGTFMAAESISERGDNTPVRRWRVILHAPRNVPCTMRSDGALRPADQA
jgi:hypothetical protein